MTRPARYFVTGATGVVGSALVQLLLARGHSVDVLVRAEHARHAAERLESLFDFWQLGAGEPQARRQLSVWRGDAALPAFGMDAAQFQALAAVTDRIVHCAGAVRMNLDLESARRSAVGSAREIVDFARRCQALGRLQKVDVVSTVGVGGRLPEVPEDWLASPRSFHNTYEQAKAEAEDLLHQAVRGGLPLTVHRPSMVVGDSASGAVLSFQVFYHLCEFLSGRRTLGLFPPLEGASLDIVPVDLVARVIAWSSESPALNGHVLHVCAGPAGALPLVELRRQMRMQLRARAHWLPPQIGLSRQGFDRMLALASPLLGRRGRRAVATLPVFLDYLSTHQAFHNERTLALMRAQSADFAPPHWSDYLPRVLGAYLDHANAKPHR